MAEDLLSQKLNRLIRQDVKINITKKKRRGKVSDRRNDRGKSYRGGVCDIPSNQRQR